MAHICSCLLVHADCMKGSVEISFLFFFLHFFINFFLNDYYETLLCECSWTCISFFCSSSICLFVKVMQVHRDCFLSSNTCSIREKQFCFLGLCRSHIKDWFTISYQFLLSQRLLDDWQQYKGEKDKVTIYDWQVMSSLSLTHIQNQG